jgi:hypothetical protein
MQGTVPSRGDAPAALQMALFFLALGLYAFFRPDRLRMAMDRFADGYKRGRWHSYKMPLHVLRYGVGSVGIAGSALFFYIAHVAFTR